jgi:hypothetical protein
MMCTEGLEAARDFHTTTSRPAPLLL